MIKWRLHYPECTCTAVKPSEEFIVICVDFRKGRKKKRNMFHNPPSHAYTQTHLADDVKRFSTSVCRRESEKKASNSDGVIFKEKHIVFIYVMMTLNPLRWSPALPVRWRGWGSPTSTWLNFSEALATMMEILSEDAHTGCSSLGADQIMGHHLSTGLFMVAVRWGSSRRFVINERLIAIYWLIWSAVWYINQRMRPRSETVKWFFICFSFEDFYRLFSQQKWKK